ncbi:MAG: hypothetical protein RIT81_14645 [Deltaproteobacteria bacterium]
MFGVLALFAVALFAGNLSTLIPRPDGRHVSPVPIFGGLAGAGALLVVPLEGVQAWWWATLVFDPWCLLYLGVAVVVIGAEAARARR